MTYWLECQTLIMWGPSDILVRMSDSYWGPSDILVRMWGLNHLAAIQSLDNFVHPHCLSSLRCINDSSRYK